MVALLLLKYSNNVQVYCDYFYKIVVPQHSGLFCCISTGVDSISASFRNYWAAPQAAIAVKKKQSIGVNGVVTTLSLYGSAFFVHANVGI